LGSWLPGSGLIRGIGPHFAAMRHSSLVLTMLARRGENVYTDPSSVRRAADYGGQAPAYSTWPARRRRGRGPPGGSLRTRAAACARLEKGSDPFLLETAPAIRHRDSPSGCNPILLTPVRVIWNVTPMFPADPVSRTSHFERVIELLKELIIQARTIFVRIVHEEAEPAVALADHQTDDLWLRS